MAQLGPVSDQGVCFFHGDDLHCVSPYDGDLIWTQNDVGNRGLIYGDEDHVFTTRDSDGLTKVFRLFDGKQIAEGKAPGASFIG